MSAKDMIRYYFTKRLTVVMESQVIAWLADHRESGLDSNLIILKQGEAPTLDDKKRVSIESRIGGRITERRYSQGNIVGVIRKTLALAKELIRQEKSTGRLLVLQSRALIISYALCKLANRPNVRVVCEFRATLAELDDYMKASFAQKMKRKLLGYFEKKVLERAHASIVVSQVMKDYFVRKHPRICHDRIYVVPGAGDQKVFSYSEERARALKAQHGLADRKVVVYSGGIDMPWQVPDKIIGLFKALHAQDSRFFLLILTRTPELGRKLLDDAGISADDSRLDFVNHQQLNEYLNLSDVALLLREDIPTNHQASPTKFAEYILAGLPCIITPWVGDYSALTAQLDLGYIIPDLDLDPQEMRKLHAWLGEYIEGDYWATRERIALLALQHASKAVYNDFFLEMLAQDAPIKR